MEQDQYLETANIDAILKVARLGLYDANREAFDELLDYLEDDVLNGDTWPQMNRVSDFVDALETITAGLLVIDYTSGDDLEEALTNEVGVNYAESLDNLVQRASAANPQMPDVPRALVDYLRHLTAIIGKE